MNLQYLYQTLENQIYFTNTFQNEQTTCLKEKHLEIQEAVLIGCYTSEKCTKYEMCAFLKMYTFHICTFSVVVHAGKEKLREKSLFTIDLISVEIAGSTGTPAISITLTNPS